MPQKRIAPKLPPKMLATVFIVVRGRVARWYIFRTKIANWVNFGGSFNGRCWCILWPFEVFYGHLIHFMAIWYILW
jgi:hypothetical protein